MKYWKSIAKQSYKKKVTCCKICEFRFQLEVFSERDGCTACALKDHAFWLDATFLSGRHVRPHLSTYTPTVIIYLSRLQPSYSLTHWPAC